MAFKTVFERYELKYIITSEQKERLRAAISPYMRIDDYGRSTIRNVYFDTDSFRLIRRSIEKPVYKEKLRIRSYSQVTPEDTVFVELKKKYDGVVYKRRVSMSEKRAMDWASNKSFAGESTQISREIDYFLEHYSPLRPKVFISYDREAYKSLDGSDLRVTFDENILFRTRELSLTGEIYGEELLGCGEVLMEIKCSGGIPMWMARILSREHIYKTSFSKYGTAYQRMMRRDQSDNNIKEDMIHA